MNKRFTLTGIFATTVLLVGACATGGSGSGSDDASDYPGSGTIKLLIPYGAGGGTDLAGRLMASGLEKDLGAKIVIENNPAASGQQALTQLAAAKPDGYTLGFTPLPAANMMYLDTERGAKFTAGSFTPIANHDTDPVAIGVSAKSKFKDLDDLIAAAKADPGDVTAGSNGVLAAGHLGLLQLEKATGIKVTWTSFDDAGQLRTSVLGGSVDLEVQPVSELTTPKANGSMRILAILSDERMPGLDDVKTAKELGFPDAVVATNRILLGPKGLPKEIVETLSASVEKSIGESSYEAQAKKRLLALNYKDAADTAAMWKGFDTTFANTAQEFRDSSK